MTKPTEDEIKEIYEILFDLHEFVLDAIRYSQLSGDDKEKVIDAFAKRFRPSIEKVATKLNLGK